MNKMLSLFLLLLSFKAMAVIEESLWVSDPSGELLSKIQKNQEFIVDHVSHEGFELYGPEGTADYLKKLGAFYFFQEEFSSQFAPDDYPSYEEITASIKAVVKTYPEIMSLESIGKSVSGRELWMVKVSDNVAMDELEPEFKYISSMHGDEIVGRELMILFLNDLGENYRAGNKQAVELINNTELFIMPSMNPDGSERRRRANDHGYDLNRNFPDFTRRDSNTIRGRQPETKAIMKFQKKRNFSLSANFHGGAVVVNYPWDGTHDLHPLDDLVKTLSLGYAALNDPMRTSREFSRGIINGADWYVVKGGMQDWSYAFHNDLQVTIELSDIKWPDYAQIDQFYQDNRESLYYYASMIHQGAGFKLVGDKEEEKVS